MSSILCTIAADIYPHSQHSMHQTDIFSIGGKKKVIIAADICVHCTDISSVGGKKLTIVVDICVHCTIIPSIPYLQQTSSLLEVRKKVHIAVDISVHCTILPSMPPTDIFSFGGIAVDICVHCTTILSIPCTQQTYSLLEVRK